jgi:hypothetical protein
MEIMVRKLRRKEKKRNWKMKRQVMLKTRKEACHGPPSLKHPVEVDTFWNEKIKTVVSVQVRVRVQIWTEKENGEETILSNLIPRQQHYVGKGICPD